MGKSKRNRSHMPDRRAVRAERNQRSADTSQSNDQGMSSLPILKIERKREPLTPQTPSQHRFFKAIKSKRYAFGIGPAGTGKTYLAARYAASCLRRNIDNPTGGIERIYLTRSPVEVGPKIGFLPGSMEEKLWPYLKPFFKGLSHELGSGHVMGLIKSGRIVVSPLSFMQGESFDEECILLCDEAENTTPVEMKMLLTRLGAGCRMIITGDDDQKMIQGKSGLIDGAELLKYSSLAEIVHLSPQDSVRSDEVREVLELYRKRDASVKEQAVNDDIGDAA